MIAARTSESVTLGLLVALSASSCAKHEPKKLRTEPWENPLYGASAAPSASVPGALTSPVGEEERYVLDPVESRVSFVLPGKKAAPRGHLQALEGELFVNRASLEKVHGTLRFDLTTIQLDSTTNLDSGIEITTPTALNWLELGASVPDAIRARHRYATVELKGAQLPGATLSLAQARAAASEPKPITATVHGELSLHGFRVPLDVPVQIQRPPSSVPGEALTIRATPHVTVHLAEHDLRPRDPAGSVIAKDLPLLGTEVGKDARVEFELVWRARPKTP